MTPQTSRNSQDIIYDSIKWKWADDDICIGKICKKLVLMQANRCPRGYCSQIKWTKKSVLFDPSPSIEEAQQVCMNGFADWIYKKADTFINLKIEDVKWETIKNKNSKVVGLVADLDGYFELHVYTNAVLGIKKIMCNIIGASDVYVMTKEFDYSPEGIKEAKTYCLGKLKSTLIAFREDYRKRNDQRVAKFDNKIDTEQEELLLFDDSGDSRFDSFSDFEKDESVAMIDVGDKVMLIDKNDVDYISNHTWHLKKKKDKYVAITESMKDNNGQSFRRYAHSVILGVGYGVQIRHKNGNGLDNRKCNLEIMTINKPLTQRAVFSHEGRRLGIIIADRFYKNLDVK